MNWRQTDGQQHLHRQQDNPQAIQVDDECWWEGQAEEGAEEVSVFGGLIGMFAQAQAESGRQERAACAAQANAREAAYSPAQQIEGGLYISFQKSRRDGVWELPK